MNNSPEATYPTIAGSNADDIIRTRLPQLMVRDGRLRAAFQIDEHIPPQTIDLTLLLRQGYQCLHLTGTDYFERIDDPELDAFKPYWEQNLESETPDFYRAEYLAGQVLEALSKGQLQHSDDLLELVSEFAAPRDQEGYEKGIHNHDAAQILQQVIPTRNKAGLLRFDPLVRGIAMVFWAETREHPPHHNWLERARAAGAIWRVFGDDRGKQQLANEIAEALKSFVSAQGFSSAKSPVHRSPSTAAGRPLSAAEGRIITEAATYLTEELGNEPLNFTTSRYAQRLVDDLRYRLATAHIEDSFQTALHQLSASPAQRWDYIDAWLQAMFKDKDEKLIHYIPEAIALISDTARAQNGAEALPRQPLDVDLELHIDQLLGEHPLIQNSEGRRFLPLSLDQFFSRYQHHCQQVLPAYQRYLQVRADVIEQHRQRLIGRPLTCCYDLPDPIANTEDLHESN